MEIYLIRHTTPDIQKGLIYGKMEVPLKSSFALERDILLKQLPACLGALYSSPSGRCCALARAIDKNYHIDEGLYEMNFGDWEGKTWDTINRTESERWMEDFVHRSPPNGESMLAMQQRVMETWYKITATAVHHPIAVVTHAGVIRIILAHYGNIPLKNSFDLKVDFGSVFKLCVSSS